MEALPIIALAASTVASVGGSIYSGISQKNTADKEAKQTRIAAQAKAEDTAKQNRRILGAQRARYAASGVSMEGSPLLVQMESLKESEEEIQRILQTGYARAEASEEAGSSALTSGLIRAGGSLATGAGKMYAYVKSPETLEPDKTGYYGKDHRLNLWD